MGKQFKTIPSITRQVSGDLSQSVENESVNSNTPIDSTGGVRPLLRLPMASSATANSQAQAQSSQAGTQTIFPAQANPPHTPRPAALDNLSAAPSAFQGNPPSQAGPFGAAPGASSIGYAPTSQAGLFMPPQTPRVPDRVPPAARPGASSRPFETPSAGYEREQFASTREETPRSRLQAPTKKNKKRRSAAMAVALCCCLGLCLLAGSGYWVYHAHNSASSATAPAAEPTQTRYTIAEPAPTSTATATVTPAGTPSSRVKIPALSPVPAPWQTSGQLIVVSILKQKLTAYSAGKPEMTTLVTTGMPTLYTPEATYHIIGRVTNSMFNSPWPPSSPNYYAPIHVNYGLQLTSSGIYLHDATWRSVFGPGTNVPHKDPVYGEETGSHGCVELPLTAMKWLYNWAPNGIAVAVVD